MINRIRSTRAVVLLISQLMFHCFFAGSCRASVIETVGGLQSSIAEIIATGPEGYRKGAGVIARQDGLIVSNLHIVHGASRITVRVDRSAPTPAKVMRVYPEYDLIVLKTLLPRPATPVRLATDQDLSLRQTVYHVGSSYLLEGTISEGRITGLGTSKSHGIRAPRDFDIIRVNIQLFKGDSGGPLFNQAGHLIGMVVAAHTKKHRVSFAVPVNKIKKILSDL